MTDINPLTVNTHPDEVAAMCLILGPYRPYLAALPQIAVAAFNPTKFASDMANKDSQKEIDKVRSSFNKMISLSVGGKIKSIKSAGELNTITWLVLNTYVVKCNQARTKVELKNMLLQMADSNNVA